MFKSRPKAMEELNGRVTHHMKEYTTEGENIPLSKKWLDSWCTLPNGFDTVLPEILDYEVRADDVFVVTFMKSGTTWMQETAFLLLNDLDFEKCKMKPILERSPFIDFHGIMVKAPNAVEYSKTVASPRLIKTHMPAHLMPRQIWERKQKVIYVARNCKDVIISSFHFMKNLGTWRGDNLEDYANDFMKNCTAYTNYWTHVVDFWKMRNEPFIFFITYEEMKRDLAGVLQKLSKFLNKPQLTPQQMEQALKHLSFGSMKENKHTNPTHALKVNVPSSKDTFQFMRRGIVGSYKDELAPEVIEKIDNWSRTCLAQHGITEEDIFGKF